MSAIYLPDGQNAVQPKREQPVIVMATPDGKELMFPQVAIAMCSPDVINLIAQAVVNLLQKGEMVNEKGEFFVPEEPKSE